MLLTASKVYVRHPEIDLAKINRDHVFMEVCKAVGTISDVAQGKSYRPVDMACGAGELAAALDDLDASFNFFIQYLSIELKTKFEFIYI